MEKVKFLICGDVKKPQRKFGDAGIDCFVPNRTEQFIEDIKKCNEARVSNNEIIIGDTIRVMPGCDIKFPLYIKSLIEPDTVLIVTNKSGVCTKQKFAVGASTIDNSYQGTHHAHIYNFSNDPQTIEFGQKIVQEVPIRINPDDIIVEEGISAEEFYDGVKTSRGDGGFGSSGIY